MRDNEIIKESGEQIVRGFEDGMHARNLDLMNALGKMMMGEKKTNLEEKKDNGKAFADR